TEDRLLASRGNSVSRSFQPRCIELEKRQSTVNEHGRTSHRLSIWREHISNGSSNVVRALQVSKRDTTIDPSCVLGVVVQGVTGHTGVDNARRDSIDSDPMWCELPGHL